MKASRLELMDHCVLKNGRLEVSFDHCPEYMGKRHLGELISLVQWNRGIWCVSLSKMTFHPKQETFREFFSTLLAIPHLVALELHGYLTFLQIQIVCKEARESNLKTLEFSCYKRSRKALRLIADLSTHSRIFRVTY